jgi:hypothetical protein
VTTKKEIIMQVRQLFAAALVSVSALGTAAAIAGDGSTTNAVGTTTYSAHSERTREAVVGELRAAAAPSADGSVTNAVGTTSYPFQGERSRASVVAELRNAQALGQWRPAGEVGDAPVVQQIQQDTALAQGQARINVAQGRVFARKAQSLN